MAQRLEQTQTEQQVQQLSSLQIAMAQLLELPLMDLRERVRNEMEDNEALEEAGADGDADYDMSDSDGDHDHDEESSGELGDRETTDTSDEAADYLTDDDIPDYLLRQQNAAEEREWQLSDNATSYDDLFRQMGEHDFSEHEREVMEYIIGSLDGDGYLRKSNDTLSDEMAVYQGIEASPEEIEHLVRTLQTFEPRGIGARTLQECLRLQVDDPDFRSPYKQTALDLLDRCFQDFAAHHWDVVRRKLKIDNDTFEKTTQLLTRLNPRPGSALGESVTAAAPTVIPDFFVTVDADGIPSVSLNNGDVPELRVSRAFKDTVREYSAHKDKLSRQQHDELLYARKKVGDAQLFVEMVQRRRHTLLSVMRAIVQIQLAFFSGDDDEALLIPMVLKDVAQHAGVDISTVSRVTNSKYVQTAYGVYPLKFFFSMQFTAGSGEELSSRQVKAALREVVEAEDKRRPLNDERIAEELGRRGFPISRRTVVKYRDQLGIPSSRLRKS